MSAATIDVPVFDLDRARSARRRGDAVVLDFPTRTAGAPSKALRLTRRGRLVVTVAAASLLTVAGLAVASTALAGPSGSLSTGAVASGAATEQVVVHPGQTLWEIAAAVAPAGADVRDVIIDITELNGLESSAVLAGQELTVPVG